MKRCRKCGLVAFGEEKSCRGCRSRSFDPIGREEVTLADAIAYIKAMDGDRAYERDACLAALADLAPHLEAERNQLSIAFNCGAVGFLARGDVSSAMRLMDQAYLSPAISNQIVAAYTGNNAIGETAAQQVSTPTAASLRDRGLLLLEDGEVEKAGRYFERALDIDPRDAMSYLGQVMIAQEVSTVSELSSCNFDLSSSPDFLRAMQFAQGEERDLIAAIEDSVEQAQKDRAAAEACERARDLAARGNLIDLERAVEGLRFHKGSTEADELLKSIQSKIKTYKDAQSLISTGSAVDLMKAFAKIEAVSDLLEAGSLAGEAMDKFKSSKDVQDCLSKGTVEGLLEIVELIKAIKGVKDSDRVLREVLVGTKVKMGAWAGKKIDWRVLDVVDGHALFISERAIDCKPYNDKHRNEANLLVALGAFVDSAKVNISRGVTWENCSLRSWLNGEFFFNAFSDSERHHVKETNVTNGNNSKYDIDGGADTKDWVFCLSKDEARRYFKDNSDRICVPSLHAKRERVNTNFIGACDWWLRSPGDAQNKATFVSRETGSILPFGQSVANAHTGVRPALWFELKKDQEQGVDYSEAQEGSLTCDGKETEEPVNLSVAPESALHGFVDDHSESSRSWHKVMRDKFSAGMNKLKTFIARTGIEKKKLLFGLLAALLVITSLFGFLGWKANHSTAVWNEKRDGHSAPVYITAIDVNYVSSQNERLIQCVFHNNTSRKIDSIIFVVIDGDGNKQTCTLNGTLGPHEDYSTYAKSTGWSAPSSFRESGPYSCYIKRVQFKSGDRWLPGN